MSTFQAPPLFSFTARERRGPAAYTIAVGLGLLALVALYFSDFLTGQLLLVERDLTTFFYPFRFIWVETVRQSQFPFWNPYIKCGVPLFATVQPGVLYPMSFLYLLLPLDLAFNWLIILHFFLAAVFTYTLMRELGVSVQGSLAGALAFLFSGYLISVHNVLNTLISASWYPLVILCCCRMVRTGLKRWTVAGGASICCMFLGGGMEIVIFTLASLLLLCLYPNFLPLRDMASSPGLGSRLILLSLTFFIFLGLSMIQLLPFLELYRHSDRYLGVSLKEAVRWSLPPRDLIYFLLPELYGPRTSPERYWELQNYLKTIYVGPVVFSLVGFYFIRGGKRGLALLAAMGLALIFALGGYTPLYGFFHQYFPLFTTLRYPVKFLFPFIFFLCVAAGLGLDVFRHRFSQDNRPPAWLQGILITGVVVLAGVFWFARFNPELMKALVQQWGASSLEPDHLRLVLHNFNRVLVFTSLVLLLVFFGLRQRLARLGGPLFLILLTLDLFLGNRGFAVKLDSTFFHGETEIIRTLRADPDLFRFHVLPEVRQLEITLESYREFHRNRKEFLGYDLMMEHHLFDIDGYNVPLQPRYEAIINLVRGKPLSPQVQSLLNLLNVKYVLAAEPIELPGYVYVQDGLAQSKLYENRNALPRAFLVRDYQVLESEEDFARAYHELTFDPGNTILLEKVPKQFLQLEKKPTMPQVESTVRMLTYENNRLVLQVNTPEAAMLFMTEAYYPGWQAYVDGKREEILRANYAFRAITLGPGSHRVEMVYESFSFKVGSALSLATVFLILIFWLISLRRDPWSGLRQRRHRTGQSHQP